jgi:hypothetical protein
MESMDLMHSKVFYALGQAGSAPVLYQQGLDYWFDDSRFHVLIKDVYLNETPEATLKLLLFVKPLRLQIEPHKLRPNVKLPI